jgi:hypothetical protein
VDVVEGNEVVVKGLLVGKCVLEGDYTAEA